MKTFSLNSEELKAYQQNRYPLLLIDYVTKVEPGVFAEGYKNLTNNDSFTDEEMIHFKICESANHEK